MRTAIIDMHGSGRWTGGAAPRLAGLVRRAPRYRVYYRGVPERLEPVDGRLSPSVPASPDLRLLLTVQEACAVLRVSRWTLYRLIHTRQLDTIKIGSRRCVPVASVRALIDRLSDREGA